MVEDKPQLTGSVLPVYLFAAVLCLTEGER